MTHQDTCRPFGSPIHWSPLFESQNIYGRETKKVLTDSDISRLSEAAIMCKISISVRI